MSMSHQKPFVIRPAVASDCKDIKSLIQELADYEKMSDGVKITEHAVNPAQ